MAWTIAERDALKKAIASGRQEVSYGDRRVKYRSLNEMKEILADMEKELGIRSAQSRVYMTTSLGLRS